ncbi:UDP-glucose 4-epimerase [Limihaloglobus sulfuriphilus]|uniref:UDP-glucose 4-epimerase n=1 Tax=Limihaloglobus sulfuriphilus TaxID=1851148 RepID=A0A1Q2MFM4_9BACT|nr:NAD(P)-dependent oxidoreductase [Limihaloglobus sulfuriphilus]AQQ71503.1 UDP-glucose 4-epimerase [Limihaloglobus sulfuriphilus]
MICLKENIKILIVGANGFLGAHLLRYFEEKGASIVAVDISLPEFDSSKYSDRVKWCKVDILQDDLSDYLQRVDVVYHLAGKYLPGNSAQVLNELCTLNVEGTKRVLKASVNAGVKCFIHISSAAVCGRIDGGVIKEEDIMPNESYGLSKLRSEDVVKEICNNKMEYVIVRPTAFFGENHLGSLYEMVRAIKHKRYCIIGDGENHMNFLYVRDLVEILVELANNFDSYNQTFLVADRPIALKDFTNLTRKELGLKPTSLYMPKLIGLLIGGGFDLVSKLLRRSMPLSLKRVANMTNDCRYDGSKILEKLSLKLPYGVEKGWSKTIEWYKSNDLL